MSTTTSSVVSHFPKPQDGFTATLAGSITAGATSFTLSTTGNYSNGDIVVLIVDPSNSSKQACTGTIDTGGVQVTNVVWTSGTNQAHSAGATVVDYVSATHLGMMSKGILVAHSQDGTHKSGATYASPTFSGTATGTYTLGGTPTIASPTLSGTVTGAVIKNANLSTTAGELGGTWNTWSPTWSGITVSNGTVVARYYQIGKTVHFKIWYTTGSSDSFSGTFKATLPVTAAASVVTDTFLGGGKFVDAGTNTYPALTWLFDSTHMYFVAISTGSTYVGVAGVNDTTPFTWATHKSSGNILYASGTYEAA